MKLSPFVLKNAFDSHVHWEATGAFAAELNLSGLKKPEDILKINFNPQHVRDNFVLGSHWDDSSWMDGKAPNQKIPYRKILDSWANGKAVVLKRVDRHSVWVSTRTLELAGLMYRRESSRIPGGEIEIDQEGWPTGILKDLAMKQVEALVPAKSQTEVQENLYRGMHVFHSGGFTHIRDMTCDPVQFESIRDLSNRGELRLAVEQFFDVHTQDQLSQVLGYIDQIKNHTVRLLRIRGIKLFYDGALGSEGAWISRPYYGCGVNKGFKLYEKPVLQEMISQIWKAGLEVAIHTIGDQAAQDVIEIATELYQSGTRGIFHLEHAEMLRPETIELMRDLQVTCHFQPCHWLSDKKWVERKLGPLTAYLFRWGELEQNNIPFYFGSDAPIEPSSIVLTYKALMDAQSNGIPNVLGEWTKYVQHPDLNWSPGCHCEISNDQVVQTVFQGQTVFTHA